MNIGERATMIAHQYRRDEVLDEAQRALFRITSTDASELVGGHDVAWLLAAAMLKDTINGSGPRVVTRIMDDGVRIKDGIG